MQRQFIAPVILAVTAMSPAVSQTGAALAQPIDRPASNITPFDAHSVIAPALPAPPVPSADPPSVFLVAARDAVRAGRTGEAQEALERAETRLLDRTLPSPVAPLADNRQAVLAMVVARRALAVHDRQGAIAAIDDALAAVDRPHLQVATAMAPGATAVPAVPPAPPLPQPVITRALLPAHWALHGARYVWIPPETTLRRVQSAGLVPGAYVWRDGAYVWVPTHYEN